MIIKISIKQDVFSSAIKPFPYTMEQSILVTSAGKQLFQAATDVKLTLVLKK
jgi:hypothetical protein